MTKKRISSGGLVYSTNKDIRLYEEESESEILPEKDQKLKIMLDSKHRGGKTVTLIDGFKGPGAEELGKKLKSYCGTGGAVKDNQIIVQGDNRDKVLQWLLKNNFTGSKKI